jgi:hypothetical protein
MLCTAAGAICVSHANAAAIRVRVVVKEGIDAREGRRMLA